MNSIDVETLFAILFVEIDNWYQPKGRQWLRGKVGRPAEFSESEVMTLMLESEFLLSMDILNIQTHLLRIRTKFI